MNSLLLNEFFTLPDFMLINTGKDIFTQYWGSFRSKDIQLENTVDISTMRISVWAKDSQGGGYQRGRGCGEHEESKGGQIYGDGRRLDCGWWAHKATQIMYYIMIHLKVI